MRAELDARIEDYESGKTPARDDWRKALADKRRKP